MNQLTSRLSESNNQIMRIAAIIFTLILGAGAAHAQSTPRREDPFQRKLQSVVQLEMIEAALTRPANSSNERSTALAQISEDFWRIQLANDALVVSLSGTSNLDSRLVAKTAAEIRTRAKRLKENLALPAPEKDSTIAADFAAGDIRSSIASLSKLIDSFVSNPMLSQRHMVDATLSLTAGRDLEHIIILSGEIRKTAARLK
ncbi:MAG TPA: hypothetical protein VHP99_10935 [Pyrinomonadaceae bacterium]|nr:hypothetical protein [Pyrinomonadaceae bacterium]